MEAALQEAGSQIIQKKYDSQLRPEGYTTRLQYGLVFFGKQCEIAKI
jgi:hypothetical protein